MSLRKYVDVQKALWFGLVLPNSDPDPDQINYIYFDLDLDFYHELDLDLDLVPDLNSTNDIGFDVNITFLLQE